MEAVKKRTKISEDEFTARVLPILEQNLDVTVTTTGYSMFPLWKHKRDSAVLTSCDQFNLKKGDIALYKRASGQYVLHRIIKVNSESYDMCGDGQWEIEYNLPKENVIAVVIAFTRKDRKYSCRHISFRVYSALWLCMPLRKINLKIFRKLSGIIK
jgi:hypothetical protein